MKARIIALLGFLAFCFGTDQTTFNLPCEANGRAQVVSALVSAKSRQQSLIDQISFLETKWGLVALDEATFGFLASCDGNNYCSITSGAAVLTSGNNCWTIADVGKTIHVQGAGTAASTLVATIVGYTSPTSVTLSANAATTVTASRTSKAGIAIWGYIASQIIETAPLTNTDGTLAYVRSGNGLSGVGNGLLNVVNDFGATGNGTTDDRAAFASADTASVAGRVVVIPGGTYKISSNITLAGTYLFSPGAVLKPDAAVVITYNGNIVAGGYQIFDAGVGGSGSFTGTAKVDRVDARWFGMTASGSAVSNTAQFNAAVNFTYTVQGRTLWIPVAGNYYSFNTQPADIVNSISIVGDGYLSTALLRNFNGTGGIGMLNVRAAGVNIKGLGIYGANGTNTGAAIGLISTAGAGFDGLLLEDLWITVEASNDAWSIPIYIDGNLKVAGAQGCRTSSFRNVHVFGGSQRAVELRSVINFSWDGGGLYTAGGTATESIAISGPTVNAQYVNINIGNINGTVNLTGCQDVQITTTSINGVVNALSAVRCKIECTNNSGTVQTNWVDSGISGAVYSVVASAAAISLPVNAKVVNITGTTNITSITTSGGDRGRIVTLVFSGILTFTDGGNLRLGSNFVTSSDDAIILACDGVNWYETGRSTN